MTTNAAGGRSLTEEQISLSWDGEFLRLTTTVNTPEGLHRLLALLDLYRPALEAAERARAMQDSEGGRDG